MFRNKINNGKKEDNLDIIQIEIINVILFFDDLLNLFLFFLFSYMIIFKSIKFYIYFIFLIFLTYLIILFNIIML